MTSSLLAKPRRLASAAVVASMTVATLGLSVGSAFAAAPTTVTSTPATVYTTAGSAVLTYGVGAGNTASMRVATVAGANVDPAANGNNAADSICTTQPDVAGNGTCTVPLANLGSSTVTIFADLNTDNIITAGEPSVTVTVVKSGSVFSISLDKHAVSTATGAAGSVAYVATAKDINGNVVPGAALHIQATENVAAAGNPLSIAGGVPAAPGTLSGVTPNWQSDAAITASSATGSVGTASFSVSSLAAGSVLVRVFSGPDAVYDAGEATDTSTVTVISGGASGVTTVAVTPATATRYQGDVQPVTVTLTGSGGVGISGVVVNYVVTGANPVSGTVTSGAGGVVSFTYPAPNVGTDSVLVFVNQPSGSTPGRDAGEPGATVARTTVATPAVDPEPGNSTVDCVDALAGGTTFVSGVTCTIPVDQKTVALRAVVKDSSGTALSGVTVTWTSAPALATGDTLTVSSVTNSAGVATATLTIAGTPLSAGNPDYTITAKVGTVTLGNAAIDYQARAAAAPVLKPTGQAVAKGGSVTVTAKIADQFGKSVGAGTSVVFGVTGSNAVSNTTKTTVADGTATFTYTDTSASTLPGRTDTITVTANSLTSTAKAFFYVNAAAATVELDVSGAASFATGSNVNPSVALGGGGLAFAVRVKNAAGDPLAGKTVTFTATNGTFFQPFPDPNVTISADGKTLTTKTDDGSVFPNGEIFIGFRSIHSGVITITATVDGVKGTGTVTVANPNPVTGPRFITPEPKSDAVVSIQSGDLKNLRFKVTDRYGNGVPGVTVTFNNTGAGFFFGGTNSATAVTGVDGVVSVAVTSLSTSVGAANVVASFPANAESAMGAVTDPDVGAVAAGNSSTTAVVTFGNKPTITGPRFRYGAGPITITGHAIPGATVALYQSGAVVASTTANATTGVYSFLRHISSNSGYQVKVNGQLSGTYSVKVYFVVTLRVSSAHSHLYISTHLNPAVANVNVGFYSVAGGLRRYLGSARTNSLGVASFSMAFKAGTKLAITTQAIATRLNGSTGYVAVKLITIVK